MDGIYIMLCYIILVRVGLGWFGLGGERERGREFPICLYRLVMDSEYLWTGLGVLAYITHLFCSSTGFGKGVVSSLLCCRWVE